MAKEPPPTIGDLRRKAVITDDEITAATDAYLDDPKVKAFQFTSGHVVDVAAAVTGHTPSVLVYCDPHARPADKRRAVLASLLLTRPAILGCPGGT